MSVDVRLWVYSPWALWGTNSWSGVVPHMAQAISDLAESDPNCTVHYLDPVQCRDALQERLRARLQGMLPGRYLPRHTLATATVRSRALREQLMKSRHERPVRKQQVGQRPSVDIMVAIAASTDVLNVPHDIGLIQVTDATFHAIEGFYPLYQDLTRRAIRQGKRVEQRGAGVTDHYMAASQWAADSLMREVGVQPENITVAPFGPAITHNHEQKPIAKTASETLRVLFVCSDWHRKAGDRVVKVLEAVRAQRPVHLTVVGEVTADLPSWVQTTGRLSQEALAQEYARHDLLLDLAMANAAGVVITDALCAGLPVVAAGVGGVGSIITHGQSGWIVPVQESDTPDAVQQRCVQLLVGLDRATIAQAAQAARRDGHRRLSWKVWEQSLQRVVQKVRASQEESGRYQAVMVTPIVPGDTAHESAGETLVGRFHHELSAGRKTLVLSADGPANERVIRRGVSCEYKLIAPVTGTLVQRIATRVQRMCALSPVFSFSELRSYSRQGKSDALSALASAEVIDLQWQEQAVLIPALRRINPSARIVLTLHDVLSQRYRRQARESRGALRSAVWAIRACVAWAVELAAMVTADHIVVLSGKDADLLPQVRWWPNHKRATVHVVPPAIEAPARACAPVAAADRKPRLLFVGYLARWENEDGLLWFVHHSLPLIKEHYPDIECVIAGVGHRPAVVEQLRQAGAQLPGFVADIDQEYALADVVIVPLRLGGGVKFKVVDALLRAVPVVTTSVGIEGIGDGTWAACVADTPEGFADGVLEILRDPEAANTRSQQIVHEVATAFGVDAFRQAVKAVYQ